MAVIAHAKKELDGGLEKLRTALFDEGITDPIWYEVPKSKKAPKKVRKAVEKGAELVLVWGGDGTVQRCVQELAGSGVALGILPAGTANLLASSIEIPVDLDGALKVALHGERRVLDVGVINGERFTVMAGAGFDAWMVADADRGAKDRFGRLAYIWTGLKATKGAAFRARIEVDGTTWFDGASSCVLIGNLGTVTGGLVVFDQAQPDDGRLEVGVVTADGPWSWARVLARVAVRQTRRSSFARTTGGRKIDIEFGRKVRYELDGGDRKPTRRLELRIEPRAIEICVPPGQST
ncbi:MAG: diacylglycerol/lipid kinase family protein [Actinomycetes bacterium]